MTSILNYPIKDEIEIDEYKIILADWMPIPNISSDLNRNVYCIDKSGNLVWQIEKFSHYPGVGSQDVKKMCSYVGINYVEGKLYLVNWCDLAVTVDYKTGKVLEKEEVR